MFNWDLAINEAGRERTFLKKEDLRLLLAEFAPSCFSNWHRQFIITGYYKNGIVSIDPTLATKETGEKIFKLAVEKISEFVKEFVSE